MIPNNQWWFNSLQKNTNSYIEATGGAITRNGNFIIHTFTSNGNFNIIKFPTGSKIWTLVVGGGGGGAGWFYGGSGGAGGYINRAGYTPSLGLGSYPITIGAGGIGGINVNLPAADGTKGGNTTFDNLIAYGGGAGTHYTGSNTNINGGSGGSEYGNTGQGNTPIIYPVQGFNSGIGLFSGGNIYQGGGGGATGVGSNGTGNSFPSGGTGATNYMTGSSVVYSTGGLGTYNNADGVSGNANTGDGGQGSGILAGIGGNGGSGVVRIAYYSPITTPSELGNLATFTYASGDYSKIGSNGTITYNAGNSIRIQDTNFNDNNSFVKLDNYQSDSANVLMQCDVKFNSLLSTDYGASLRVYSPFYPSILVRVGAATGVNKGVVEVYQNNILLATLGTLPTLNSGDVINFKIRLIDNKFTFTITNGTDIVTGNYTYNFNYTNSPTFVPPTYTLAFGSSGGDYLFSNASIYCYDKKESDLIIVGDSRSYGLFAGGTTPANRVSNLWKNNNLIKKVYNLSGSGEQMVHLLSRLSEIINYAPRQIIICMVLNDIIVGRTDLQILQSFQSIVYQLESRGIACNIQISPGCGVAVQSGANTLINNYFPGYCIPEPPTWNPVTDNEADLTHWTAAAQSKIYNNQITYITL